MPAGRVAAGHGAEAGPQRGPAAGQGGRRAGGEAQGQRVGGVPGQAGERQPRRLDHVPVSRAAVVPGHLPVSLQVGPAVGGPEVAVGRLGEAGPGGERAGQPVARGDQGAVRGVAAVVVPVVAQRGLVEEIEPVPAAVEGGKAQLDEHGGPGRVGDVGGAQPPAVVRFGVGELVRLRAPTWRAAVARFLPPAARARGRR